MPLPGKLRNYRRYAPLIISVLLLCLFAVYLATQIEQWMTLSRAPAPADIYEQGAGNPGGPDMQRLEILFGSAAPSDTSAPSATASGFTLRGSFVHIEPQRSSAIVQVDGQPPRLYWHGEELSGGVSLHKVYPDRVELLRNGTVEVLHFPQVRSQSYIPDEPIDTTYQDEEPYAEPSDEETQLMQQQMDTLRQQLEDAVNQPDTTPANDQPMEDD
ncbi:secretion protein [Pseudomonas stutzeri]|uniref:Secretion protein n=1 Tax=Stutzerimonas stutzeri TaxID=316 RepID=A0A2N8RZ81_STUST|nr:type II secretion system protein N [Stutzerimonas stutzeri]MCQ4297556.1 secretion protein [Stutzerimonas stutzeri]PNF79689.1 secretion protein [Stutzerimonas stutzeri]